MNECSNGRSSIAVGVSTVSTSRPIAIDLIHVAADRALRIRTLTMCFSPCRERILRRINLNRSSFEAVERIVINQVGS